MRTRINQDPWGPSRALVAAALLACSDDTTGPVPVTTGAIQITASTTGVDIPETYNAFAGGRMAAVCATGAGTTITGLQPGSHNVRLDLTRNCEVAGDNPRATTVAKIH